MLAFGLAIATTSYLLACVLIFAHRKVGYSHIKHTISEIGELGARDQHFAAYAVFLPVGLTALWVAYLVRASSLAAASLGLCIAIGYLGAAAFPCDRGCPSFGGVRQSFHNLAGGVEYIGGGLALMALAQTLGAPFQGAGLAVLVSAFLLSFVPQASVRGAVQRFAEVCLFGGLSLATWRLASPA